MIVSNVTRGRTFKRVTFQDVPANTEDKKLLGAALDAAHENRSSIWDYSVTDLDWGFVDVTLWTD